MKSDIPIGWSVKSLVDCISKEKNAIVDGPFGTQMKISEYVNKGVPVYEMEQLNGAFIVDNPKHFLTEEKYEEVKRSSVKNGDKVWFTAIVAEGYAFSGWYLGDELQSTEESYEATISYAGTTPTTLEYEARFVVV
jgi:hypothetical protein